MSNLALTWRVIGDLENARDLYQQVLILPMRAQEPQHSDIYTTRAALAFVLELMDDHSNALHIMLDNLHGFRAIFDKCPTTDALKSIVKTQIVIARLFRKVGDLSQAQATIYYVIQLLEPFSDKNPETWAKNWIISQGLRGSILFYNGDSEQATYRLIEALSLAKKHQKIDLIELINRELEKVGGD
ncbi:tetratricopeptide repeat protein [Colwellia sp. BRX9-1]|uniref:tetratricopeptide repeat protein n=1 Tax=Colwellia sp. BRX9-1 TaxID=2759830 RepID=UPI0015F49FCB|nr:tetratricopeptide repeat protein [Colwellia sp. BRX9-1]MBA6352718.1 tetratricopeptide repeat protein [Colwellia sp. BRX9-1]